MATPRDPAEQYEPLRADVGKLLAQARALELVALITVAALFAWFLTQEQIDLALPLAAWFMPAAVAILAGIRALGLYRRAALAAAYLRRVEEQCFVDTGLPGWERFVAASGTARRRDLAAAVFWLLLIAAALGAPFAFGLFDDPSEATVRTTANARA